MRATGLLLAVLLLLVGCTSDDPTPGETATGGEASPEADATAEPPVEELDEPADDEQTADEQTADDPTADEQTGGSAATVEHGEPLAVLEGPNDGAVLAEIQQLRHTGQTVELSVLIRNTHEDEGWGAGYGNLDNFLSGGLGSDDPAFSSIAGVALIDGENNKRHYPLRDPEGNCACSTGKINAGAGQSLGLFASFPAPPEDVEAMTVQIPQFGSIEVPLQ